MSLAGYIILSLVVVGLMAAFMYMECDECIGTAGIVVTLIVGMWLTGGSIDG